MKRLSIVLLAVALLTLVGCGGKEKEKLSPEVPTSETKAPDGGPGEYKFESNGATGIITISGKDQASIANDKDVLALEKNREETEQPPIYYAKIDLDNKVSWDRRGQL